MTNDPDNLYNYRNQIKKVENFHYLGSIMGLDRLPNMDKRKTPCMAENSRNVKLILQSYIIINKIKTMNCNC